LVDPEKPPVHPEGFIGKTDMILVGGSGANGSNWDSELHHLFSLPIPVYLFPGNHTQICKKADGVLILNLLSGNNAQFLGEEQRKAALQINELQLTTHPTSYLLVDGGHTSTTQKITQTKPIHNMANDHSASLFLLSKQLGKQSIYLEAGSGAVEPVNPTLIRQAKKLCPEMHVFVGGGIKTPEQAKAAWDAGANTVVIGNHLEENPDQLNTFWLIK
jgi:geranylgeranylglyceryl phosphate synthase family protein